ncbi:hypothetical protein ONZ51_g10054 [Trametes cubensis]|uniref:Uncharacterized protein n=1 Tax=Trametes cubensis TaxID=1111947 RepID=A0AAD7TK75_9APHY|nr:hypothetical protein ONZ51_g10054 [Trametes cubensis]
MVSYVGALWVNGAKSSSDFPDCSGLLRRTPTDDLTAGSANGGPNTGLNQAPSHHPAGHASSTKSSIAIPIVVLLALVSFSALLLWWIIARLRRSRRLGVPIVQVPGDDVRVKPLFLDVELEDAKHWEVSRWSQLAPVAIGFVADADRMRWDATFSSISTLKADPNSDLVPSPKSSALRPPFPIRHVL